MSHVEATERPVVAAEQARVLDLLVEQEPSRLQPAAREDIRTRVNCLPVPVDRQHFKTVDLPRVRADIETDRGGAETDDRVDLVLPRLPMELPQIGGIAPALEHIEAALPGRAHGRAFDRR